MSEVIKTLPPNTKGRDFVIGDLHGSLTCLTNLMLHLEFDASVDRIISVGDLVDRGPDSQRCLGLLDEPWFHTVLSNHEQMMVEAFDGGYMGQFWLRNGGMWGYQALMDFMAKRPMLEESAPIIEALDKIRNLPLLITVEMMDGKKFHVIHAELPPRAMPSDEDMKDPQKVLEMASVQSADGDFLLWGRNHFYTFYGKPLEHDKVVRTVAYSGKASVQTFRDELSHIISGHTILQQPLTILGQTNIDTGAYNSYANDRKWPALTAVELGTWKFYQATETEFRTVEPMVVNRADLEEIWNAQATSRNTAGRKVQQGDAEGTEGAGGSDTDF